MGVSPPNATKRRFRSLGILSPILAYLYPCLNNNLTLQGHPVVLFLQICKDGLPVKRLPRASIVRDTAILPFFALFLLLARCMDVASSCPIVSRTYSGASPRPPQESLICLWSISTCVAPQYRPNRHYFFALSFNGSRMRGSPLAIRASHHNTVNVSSAPFAVLYKPYYTYTILEHILCVGDRDLPRVSAITGPSATNDRSRTVYRLLKPFSRRTLPVYPYHEEGGTGNYYQHLSWHYSELEIYSHIQIK